LENSTEDAPQPAHGESGRQQQTSRQQRQAVWPCRAECSKHLAQCRPLRGGQAARARGETRAKIAGPVGVRRPVRVRSGALRRKRRAVASSFGRPPRARRGPAGRHGPDRIGGATHEEPYRGPGARRGPDGQGRDALRLVRTGPRPDPPPGRRPVVDAGRPSSPGPDGWWRRTSGSRPGRFRIMASARGGFGYFADRFGHLPEFFGWREMTTTIELPATVPAPLEPPPAAGARGRPSATRPEPSPTPAEPSDTFPDGPPAGSAEVPRKVKVALGIAAIVGGTVMGAIGFYLSFGNLSQAGHTVFGFSEADAPFFAVGVDVAIVTCLVLDLFMATIRTSWPLLRLLAHVMTLASVYFNAAAHGAITENWDKALSHGLMPILFVIGVEAGRRILVHQAALPADHDVIPAHRWVLAGRTTWRIFKVMKLWDIGYNEVVTRERQRAIFNAWNEYKA